MNAFIESVRSYFGGPDYLPWWCNRDVALDCEENVGDEFITMLKNGCLMRLIGTLVHSKGQELYERIHAIEATLDYDMKLMKIRERLYLLAVGYYRQKDYLRSKQFLERCLEVAPTWRAPLTLKKKIADDESTKDGVSIIKTVATAVGFVFCGFVAGVAWRRRICLKNCNLGIVISLGV